MKRLLISVLIFSAFCPLQAEGVYYPPKNHSGIPQRIVSLAPASTEILFAVQAGAQVAARTDFCDYPPEALNVPSIGGSSGIQFSIEKIISFSPDFVYLTSGMHDHLVNQLVSFGIAVYVSECCSIEDIIKEMMTIGIITGHTSEAAFAADQMKKKLSSIQHTLTAGRSRAQPSVYVELSPVPYISVGKSSFIADIIRHAGGQNIFDDIPQPYPQISEESVIMRSPEHIFILSDAPVTVQSVLNRKKWADIRAVKNKNISVIDANMFVRSGPRAVQAVRQIYSILYK